MYGLEAKPARPAAELSVWLDLDRPRNLFGLYGRAWLAWGEGLVRGIQTSLSRLGSDISFFVVLLLILELVCVPFLAPTLYVHRVLREGSDMSGRSVARLWLGWLQSTALVGWWIVWIAVAAPGVTA